MTEPSWRVGRHYGIHVYEGDRPVATFHDADEARLAVGAVNRDRGTRVPVFWRDCNCEWATKFCGEEHVRHTLVPRSVLSADG